MLFDVLRARINAFGLLDSLKVRDYGLWVAYGYLICCGIQSTIPIFLGCCMRKSHLIPSRSIPFDNAQFSGMHATIKDSPLIPPGDAE